MVVGENIKARRKQIGISQVQLAEKAGVSQATISDIERLTKAPNIYTVRAIADALGVTTAELMGEDNDPHFIERDCLTEDERRLIDYYRTMNTDAKSTLLNMARLAAGNPSAQEGLTQKSTIS